MIFSEAPFTKLQSSNITSEDKRDLVNKIKQCFSFLFPFYSIRFGIGRILLISIINKIQLDVCLLQS